MDPAYIDKLATEKKVKYPLDRQLLLDRIVGANGLKTKDSKKTGSCMATKIVPSRIFASTRQQKLLPTLEFFRNLKSWRKTILICKKGVGLCWTHKTISEKHCLPLHGRIWIKIHKLLEFVIILNSRKNCSIDYIATNIKNNAFSSLPYNKPLQEFRKSTKLLDTEFVSRRNIQPSGKVRSHSLLGKFWKMLQFSSTKPQT